MKKRHLLLTSVIMILVLVMTLTTATYAWFTSNTSVMASSVVMTARTSDAAALAIGWDGGTASSSITLGGSGSNIAPMVPATLATSGQSITTSAVTFSTATTSSTNGHLVFNEPESATPYTFTDGNGANSFYVVNLSKANSITNVQVQAEIAVNDDENYGNEKDGVSLVRVAIFKRDTSGSGSFKLIGVLAASPANNNVAYGTVAAGANAEKGANASLSYGSSVDYIDLGSLSANDEVANGADQMDFVAKVWLDGYELDDDHAGFSAVVHLIFYACPANVKYTIN